MMMKDHKKSGGAAVLHASAQLHMHDVIFHVIFGHDLPGIREMVLASAVRLHSITQCAFLAGMLRRMTVDPAAQASPPPVDMIKALFFLLLNVDMVLKEYVCNPSCIKAFSVVMNCSSASVAATATTA